MSDKIGTVYLVGAGPGDPGLITVKGLALLRVADVVVYDYLANTDLLGNIRPDAEIVYVGKKGGDHTLEQSEINDLIVSKAREGKSVVRLKGGDPYLFGRGGEEAQELRAAGIPFEVVPGVTSAIAAPAYAGIPVTHRDHASTVTFVTGHENPAKEETGLDWGVLAKNPGTLVFLMGVKNLTNISRQLIDHGKPASTPAALVRWGTTPRQVTVYSTLDAIAEDAKTAGIAPPAVFVVGSVSSLHQELDWFRTKPLFGKRILITRSRAQSRKMADRLAEFGALPILFPTIEIQPPSDFGDLDNAIKNINSYDWIIFTSVNGVEHFFKRFFQAHSDLRVLAGPKLGAIGPVTAAAIRDYNLSVELIAKEFVAEGLLEQLPESEVKGKRFLIPRAEKARDTLPQGLTAKGGLVDVVTVYRTVVPENSEISAIIERLKRHNIDAVTFTSSSTVDHFVSMLKGENIPELLKDALPASIGPITSETMRRHNIPVGVEAGEYTIEGLIAALVNHYSTKRG